MSRTGIVVKELHPGDRMGGSVGSSLEWNDAKEQEAVK